MEACLIAIVMGLAFGPAIWIGWKMAQNDGAICRRDRGR